MLAIISVGRILLLNISQLTNLTRISAQAQRKRFSGVLDHTENDFAQFIRRSFTDVIKHAISEDTQSRHNNYWLMHLFHFILESGDTLSPLRQGVVSFFPPPVSDRERGPQSSQLQPQRGKFFHTMSRVTGLNITSISSGLAISVVRRVDHFTGDHTTRIRFHHKRRPRFCFRFVETPSRADDPPVLSTSQKAASTVLGVSIAATKT